VFEGDQVATDAVDTVTHESTADPATASKHLVNELLTLLKATSCSAAEMCGPSKPPERKTPALTP
jgi:hypothetical protein